MSKSVVVTGATSGIGQATVLALARGGFDVIGTARTVAKAAELRTLADRQGVGVRMVVLDVADAESTVRGFTEIATMTDGGPWAVVNNAGIAQPGAVEDIDDERGRLQLETNLIAPTRIARLVLPSMRERRDGRIVNISSISGRISTPLLGWYCASKKGLEALSDAMRMEVAQFGVKVVLIEPGSFSTGIWQKGVCSLPRGKHHSAYGDSYDMADDLLFRARSLPDPAPVAETVRRALEASQPRARYLVGMDAKVGAVLDTLAPTALSDYAKTIATGLQTPPGLIAKFVSHLAQRRQPSP
jgi:NAD(P)-dependent dehydrogenase (short-subunit alcohol dehydrogenase family)